MGKSISKLLSIKMQLKNVFIFFSYIDVPVNDDTKIRLDQAAVDLRKVEKTVHVEEIVPNVIEPSFGIGRILHVVLESSFRQRTEGDKNSYFAFPPSIAPQKCAVLPLSAKPEFEPFVERICKFIFKFVSNSVISMKLKKKSFL